MTYGIDKEKVETQTGLLTTQWENTNHVLCAWNTRLTGLF